MTPNILRPLFGILAMTGLALGARSSGGGHTVVCFDATGAPTSAQFFDLWYAKNEGRLSIRSSDKSAVELGREITLKLYEADKDRFENLLVSYARVTRAVVRISTDLELISPLSYLGNISPRLESGCKILPLAVYADSGALLTEGGLWPFLVGETNTPDRNIHEAAFYVHEALGNLFREQARAKQTRVQTLGEEAGKEISRRAVGITALAFSTLSPPKFLRRLSRFLETGEVFESQKVDKIEIKKTITGEVFDTEEAAYADVRPQVAAYEESIKTSLGPKADFLVVDCHTTLSYGGTKNWYQAKGRCRTVAVPKSPVLTISETVHSAFFTPGGATGEEGRKDYADHFHALEKDLKNRFGEKLFFLGEEGPVLFDKLTRNIKWKYSWAREIKEGFVGIDLEPGSQDFLKQRGLQQFEKRTVGEFWAAPVVAYILVDEPEFTGTNPAIRGTTFQFYAPEKEKTEVEAARLSYLDWEKNCAEWKKAQYEAGVFYATCNLAGMQYTVNAKKSDCHFSSMGRTLVPER